MSKSRSTQRQHRRKVGHNDRGAVEHAKREKRRKREATRKEKREAYMQRVVERRAQGG